eukprot:11608919-Prorocentrum_lima.AAC.1
MQRDLENRLLAEQDHQARALIEAISGHMREQQRTQIPQGAHQHPKESGHCGRKVSINASKDWDKNQ